MDPLTKGGAIIEVIWSLLGAGVVYIVILALAETADTARASMKNAYWRRRDRR